MRFLIASLRASIWKSDRKPEPKREPREPKPLPLWAYAHPGVAGITVRAKDRSDARAMVKRHYGLRRVPAGYTPQRIG